MGKTVTIVMEVQVPAKPMEVYIALTDPQKHEDFTGTEAKGTDKEGGKFSTWDGYSFGKNLQLVKGRKIVQEWQTSEWPEEAKPSILTITLTSSKEGTLLKMVQENVPEEQAKNYENGWEEFYWEPLKAYFKRKSKIEKKGKK
ncbi:MAG: SRPBCC domain-containing protein [Candidatus Micrarchaeota archaeon]